MRILHGPMHNIHRRKCSWMCKNEFFPKFDEGWPNQIDIVGLCNTNNNYLEKIRSSALDSKIFSVLFGGRRCVAMCSVLGETSGKRIQIAYFPSYHITLISGWCYPTNITLDWRRKSPCLSISSWCYGTCSTSFDWYKIKSYSSRPLSHRIHYFMQTVKYLLKRSSPRELFLWNYHWNDTDMLL